MKFFDTITTIELVGYLVTLVVSGATLVRSFRSAEKDRELHRRFAALYATLGIVVTISVSIRYQYIEQLSLTRDEKSLEIVKDYHNLNATIDQSPSLFIKVLCKTREEQFLKTVQQATANKFTVSVDEIGRFADLLFKEETSTTIIATSYVKPSNWWREEWGKEYLRQNYEAVSSQRGCTIERIYIFSDSAEMNEPDNIELLTQQKNHGIKIYYTFASNIHDLNIKDDIIVVGEKLTGTLMLKDREMVNAEFSTNKQDIDDNKAKFQTLKTYSKPF